ncbi:MAG: hypothetical protein ACOVQG_10025 [Crocinitomicaceae bacterium]|jgi:hypothetical protein
MNILNRGFISVKPTTDFLNWKKSHSIEELIEPDIPEATVYLIEDEFWDEEEMLKKYFKKIAKQEFLGYSETVESFFPNVETVEDFLKLFTVEFGTFVIDLLKNPINSEKIDL